MRKSQEGDGRGEGELDRTDSTWPVPPVSQEPVTVLLRWRVVEIAGVVRLLGWNRTGGEGRLSSKLVGIDPNARGGLTQSGRIYVLEGPSGFDADAEWVLERWLRRHDVPMAEVRDVTNEVEAFLGKVLP